MIDYRKEDFARSGERYDLLFDVAGSRSWGEYKRMLADDGTFVGVGIAGVTSNRLLELLGYVAAMRVATLGARQKVALLWIAKVTKPDLEALGELLAAGKVRPVIDRRYPLAEVPSALEYVHDGHAAGKVVISI